MEERDPLAPGPPARHLIHQPVPGPAAGLEGAVETGDAVADVMDPWPPFGQKPGNRTVRIAGLKQLYLRVAEGEAYDSGSVGGLGQVGFQAQDVTVEGQGALEVRDGDADVGDAGGVRHSVKVIGLALGQ